jgi:hypothetical protein
MKSSFPNAAFDGVEELKSLLGKSKSRSRLRKAARAAANGVLELDSVLRRK